MKSIIKKITVFACHITNYLYPEHHWLYHFRTFIIFSFISGVFMTVSLVVFIDLDRVYELQNYKPPQPSILYDKKGRIISKYIRKNRINIKFKQIPKHLIQAFVAMEDNHFYSHHGIDFQAILRAFIVNLKSGSVKQGGSTITQQLAKVILTNKKRTYTRKLKEAILSFYIDYLLDKNQIITMYFNQIYFGHGNYGVEAASNFYFKKSIENLTIGEAAILAGLPSSPNGNSPIKYPRRSVRKLALVLLKMIDMNFISKKIALKEYKNLMDYYSNMNTASSKTAFGNRINNAPYFTETLRLILEEKLGKKKLYTQGYKIYTTLDLDHQKIAQKVLWKGLYKQSKKSQKFSFTKRLKLAKKYSDLLTLMGLSFDIPKSKRKMNIQEMKNLLYFQKHLAEKVEILNIGFGGEAKLDRFLKTIKSKNPYINQKQEVQGALIEIDQKTGGVTAMVGGLPFHSRNQINRALYAKRQPGSTFKPLLYSAAIHKKKITAATIFPDAPMIFLDENGEDWIPENYAGGYNGFITVREALRISANMVSIAIAREAKLSTVIPTIADLLQIKASQIPYNLSVALGSYEVTPLHMARAFAVFPRGGKELSIFYINKIVDKTENIVYIKENENKSSKQIISLGAATIMQSLLKNVVDRGTGRIVRKKGFKGFVGGKTGTSQNFRDAWFVGFNKRYSTAVWVGYDKSYKSLGAGQAGGVVAAPIWADFQVGISQYLSKDESYIITGDVVEREICKVSGKLKQYACTETYTEIFLKDNVVKDVCEDTHSGILLTTDQSLNKIDKIDKDDDSFLTEDDP